METPDSTALAISEQFGIRLSADTTVVIPPGATDEQIAGAAQQLQRASREASATDKMLKLWLGHLTGWYAATRGISYAEAITDLNLVEDYQVARKTFYKYRAAATRIPAEIAALPNLTMGHLEAAASVPMPEDPGKRLEFLDAQNRILLEANEDPDHRGKRWVEARMKDIRSQHGADDRRIPNQELMERFCRASVLLQNPDDEDLSHLMDRRGVPVDRSDLLDIWQSLYDALVDRDLMPATFVEIELPPLTDL